MNESILSLHRYYIWANRMRSDFDSLITNNEMRLGERDLLLLEPYMSYWYGGLYVVIEGWIKLKLSDKIIDELLQNKDNIELLRRYRNGSFHYQKFYNDNRFLDFITQKDIVQWIRTINEQFGRYFLEKARGQLYEME